MCDDHAEVWVETHPTARKEHRCCECRKTIAKGDKYWRVESLFDGAWSSNATCLVCEAHWSIFREAVDGCIMPLGLTEIEHETQTDIQDSFVLLGSIVAECMKETFYEVVL